jgi:uncharacterized membrane protein YjjP (DUF1212 family)
MTYIGSIINMHFRNGDRKKFTKDLFRKEVSGAYEMGVLDFIDEFIREIKDHELNKDEIIGELEKIALERYEKSKKTFGLFKLPKYTVDDFAR